MPLPIALLSTFRDTRVNSSRIDHDISTTMEERVVRQAKQQTRLLRDLLDRVLDHRRAARAAGGREWVEVEGDDGDARLACGGRGEVFDVFARGVERVEVV